MPVDWVGEVAWVYHWGLRGGGRGDVHAAAGEGLLEEGEEGEVFACVFSRWRHLRGGLSWHLQRLGDRCGW